jgi:competence protein ComEC
MQTIYFYSGVGGFFAGVAGVLIGLPGWPLAALCAVLAAGIAGLLARLDIQQVFIIALVVGLLAIAVGAIRASVTDRASGQYAFAPAVSKSVSATGTVVSRPTQTDSGQNFNIHIEALRVDDTSRTIAGRAKAVVYAGRFPELAYGDVVQLSGQLSKPEAFAGDGGSEFPYPQYLARKDIFYEISRPQIERIQQDEGVWFKQQMANLRSGLLSEIHEHIPDPHAALTGGVLLGAEDALGEGLQEDFRQTSLIHIVVLSGFNVMIVATAIGYGLLSLGLSLGLATVFATVGIILFALLVGLTPTVVRASIMAVFALLARVSGRRYGAGRGLALAAVGMVMVTPEILFFDPSFQLSAIATAGLIGFGDQVGNWISWIPKRFGLHEAATATIAAQIAAVPFLLYYMGALSLVSLPANLLVLPVVPVLMAVGAITILFGFVSGTLAFVGASGVYAIADYIFWVVRMLSGLPFATVSVPSLSIWVIILIYLAMFWVGYQPNQGNEVISTPPKLSS